MAQPHAKIGLFTATIIGMNAMIGSGIFAAPAVMGSYVGPAGILAYILVVISVWFTAFSLARLAQLYPEEGAFYIYAKQWGGHAIGVIAGGLYFTGLIVAMGLLAQMVGIYTHAIVPSLSPTILGAAILALLIVVNQCGLSLSAFGQQLLIVTTLLPLIIITIMCFSKAQLSNLIPFAPHGIGNALKAVRFVIFGFFGFECAASLFSIVENPEKNVPKALTYSIILVGIIYTLFVSSIILAIPLSAFTDPRIPLSETLTLIFPHHRWLIWLIHGAILSALIGTIHSMIWSAGSLLTTFTKKIWGASDENNVHQPLSQSYAVLLVGIGIFITFFTFKSLDLFFCITAFCLELAFLLSIITLLTLPTEWKNNNNIKTIMGLLTALLIIYFAISGIIIELTKIIQD